MRRPIHPVERTASQPTGRVGEVGVWGGWLAVAHFRRYLAPTNTRPHSPDRSYPLHPHCFAKGVPGEAAPYLAFNWTPAR